MAMARSGRRAPALSNYPARNALGVNFQEVVHSILTGNADVARQSDSRKTLHLHQIYRHLGISNRTTPIAFVEGDRAD
jgi:hypothetical protein